jgi:hypothetical protein
MKVSCLFLSLIAQFAMDLAIARAPVCSQALCTASVTLQVEFVAITATAATYTI